MKDTIALRMAALLTAVAVPAQAALTVNQSLGNLGPGTVNLIGDTANGANNADTYTSTGTSLMANWGNEFVFEFTISQAMTATLTSNAFTGDPDAFLLSGLGTSFDGMKNDATDGIAFAFLDGIPPESASFGLLSPGTYYLSIDSFIGFDGAVTPGDATFDYDFSLGIFIAPPPPASTDVGILGSEGVAFSVDSFGSDFDTELGLYDSNGFLLMNNDDAGGGFQSQLIVGGLAVGRYYLALGGWDTDFNDGFGANASGGTDFGDYVLNHPNGAEQGVLGTDEIVWFSFRIVPEPGALGLLALAGAGLLRRRR